MLLISLPRKITATALQSRTLLNFQVQIGANRKLDGTEGSAISITSPKRTASLQVGAINGWSMIKHFLGHGGQSTK